MKNVFSIFARGHEYVVHLCPEECYYDFDIIDKYVASNKLQIDDSIYVLTDEFLFRGFVRSGSDFGGFSNKALVFDRHEEDVFTLK